MQVRDFRTKTISLASRSEPTTDLHRISRADPPAPKRTSGAADGTGCSQPRRDPLRQPGRRRRWPGGWTTRRQSQSSPPERFDIRTLSQPVAAKLAKQIHDGIINTLKALAALTDGEGWIPLGYSAFTRWWASLVHGRRRHRRRPSALQQQSPTMKQAPPPPGRPGGWRECGHPA